MSDDLRMLLGEVGVGLVLGLAVGVLLLRRPEWCRRWTKFVLDGQWKLFAMGSVFFGLGAVGCWWADKIPHAIASGAFCALEMICLFRYGFTRLTPEMERKIDASNA